MGKIDLQRLRSGGRHTVKVVLSFEDQNGAGDKKTETMRVVYRGISLSEGQVIEDRLDAASEAKKRETLIEVLAEAVIELPDVTDNGEPVKADREFFSTLDTYYLNRINQAIQDDRAGNV
jgi:ABC-type Na+ transport system ATPase subunit NatA